MAKFLTTTGISYHIEQLIKNALERLVIISPYLRVNPRFKSLLEDKARTKIDIRIAYGKSDLQPEEINWINNLPGIRTTFLKDLHAKCYLNEREAIVTSMNLYDFSETRNEEMGIYVTKEEDPDLYNEIYREVQELLRKGQEVRLTMHEVPHKEGRETTKEETLRKVPSGGFCIRCKTAIPLNPLRPFCSACFAKWNTYKNVDYEEKYCHICGTDNKSTMMKPTCYKCYKTYKDSLEFPMATG